MTTPNYGEDFHGRHKEEIRPRGRVQADYERRTKPDHEKRPWKRGWAVRAREGGGAGQNGWVLQESGWGKGNGSFRGYEV